MFYAIPNLERHHPQGKLYSQWYSFIETLTSEFACNEEHSFFKVIKMLASTVQRTLYITNQAKSTFLKNLSIIALQCWFVLYNNVNQLYIYIYIYTHTHTHTHTHIYLLLSPPLYIVTKCTLGPLYYLAVFTSCLFYTWQCIYVSATLPIHLILTFPHCVYKSVLYVCISVHALQMGSSLLFL